MDYYDFIEGYVQSLTCQQTPLGEVWIIILTNGEAFSSHWLYKALAQAIASVEGHG